MAAPLRVVAAVLAGGLTARLLLVDLPQRVPDGIARRPGGPSRVEVWSTPAPPKGEERFRNPLTPLVVSQRVQARLDSSVMPILRLCFTTWERPPEEGGPGNYALFEVTFHNGSATRVDLLDYPVVDPPTLGCLRDALARADWSEITDEDQIGRYKLKLPLEDQGLAGEEEKEGGEE